MSATLRRQRGATLVIGLIMLVLLTLMAVSSFNLGKSNLQIVGNMQFRNQTQRAAEEAVETAISATASISTPSTASVDVNGDGTPDVAITITPTLTQAYVKKNSAINMNNAAEVGCTLGTAQTFGQVGTATGNSLCAATLYDLRVDARDTVTNTTIELHQGISIQVPADQVCSLVPC